MSRAFQLSCRFDSSTVLSILSMAVFEFLTYFAGNFSTSTNSLQSMIKEKSHTLLWRNLTLLKHQYKMNKIICYWEMYKTVPFLFTFACNLLAIHESHFKVKFFLASHVHNKITWKAIKFYRVLWIFVLYCGTISVNEQWKIHEINFSCHCDSHSYKILLQQ